MRSPKSKTLSICGSTFAPTWVVPRIASPAFSTCQSQTSIKTFLISEFLKFTEPLNWPIGSLKSVLEKEKPAQYPAPQSAEDAADKWTKMLAEN